MSKKHKIDIEDAKQIPPQLLNRLLDKLRTYLKDDETVQRMFDEYGVDLDELEYIPMKFADLEVSAKTDHGVIYYNYKLLCDGDFFKDFSYGVHEITHWLQQTTGTKPTKGSDEGNYLDNPYEQEGFQNQVEFIANEFGENEAEKYVDNLLEHHDVRDKKEKKEKKEELLALV